MNTKNKEDLLVFGITMFGLIATAAVIKLIGKAEATKPMRKINMDYVETEQRLSNGVWMCHVYYDDGEFEYEVSDHTFAAAMRSLNELVRM